MSAMDKSTQLSRMKTLAALLLIAAAGLFLLARHQDWPWVAAFAEAALIGALADWFAVVALFRHPLGLPIPHTAILPRNKARLADNLAIFIRDKFLDTPALLARLRQAKPADHLASWLQSPENAHLLAERLGVVLAESLDFMDDPRVRRLVLHALRRQAGRLDLASGVGRVLDTLTEDGRHQALLDEGLIRLSNWLGDAGVRQSFAGMIVDVAEHEYPKVVSMLGLVGINPAELGEKVAGGIVDGVCGLLAEVAADPAHPRRVAFDELVQRYVERLKTDESFRQRLDQIKREFLAHPGVGLHLREIWNELRDWMLRDIRKPDSRLRHKLASAAMALGAGLSHHDALRASLDEHLEKTITELAPGMREGMTRHIADTIRAWRDEDLVREVENSLGRDLQFIRLNGTLVGGLIGLGLHAATHFLA